MRTSSAVCRAPLRLGTTKPAGARVWGLGWLLLVAVAGCARAGRPDAQALPAAARADSTERSDGGGPKPAALARSLQARIAELRTSNGLPALEADQGLARYAQHAWDARARSASELGTGLALRVVAQGGDERALWRMLAGDPPRRAKLLNPDVTHLGIAVRASADGLVAAVVLAQLAAAADVEVAPARLLQAINRNRGARAAPALRPDPTLTQVARRAANEFFQPPERGEREIVERANAELERYGLRYRRVAALAVLVSDPLEAAALEPALDADARAVGIAAATGFRPESGVRRLAVVVALGWER